MLQDVTALISDYLLILGRAETPEAKVVLPDPQQAPPQPSTPEQDSDSENEEPVIRLPSV